MSELTIKASEKLGEALRLLNIVRDHEAEYPELDKAIDLIYEVILILPTKTFDEQKLIIEGL